MTTDNDSTRSANQAQAETPQEHTTRRMLQNLVGERNTLTLHKFIIDICGGDHLKALLLEQLMYWSERARSADGEVAKSDAHWHDELRLSPRQMRRIREWMKSVKVADVARKRSPFYGGQPVYHYTLNWKVLQQLTTAALTAELTKLTSSELAKSESSELNGPGSSEGDEPGSSFNTEPTQSLQTSPASAESVSADGKATYQTFAEKNPDLYDTDLEDVKRAAMSDIIAESTARHINNTHKDDLERTVAHLFQTGGGEARVMARMLRGKSSSKDGEAWREAGADFRGDPVEAEELTEWAAWYQRKYPDQTLAKVPHKLAGSILYWRENARREATRADDGAEYYGGYKIVG